MRVAYVCSDPGVPVFGRKGASVHVQALLRELLARGAEVDLVAARVGGAVPPGLDGVRVHELARPAVREPAERERALREADAQVGVVLDRLRPLDLVYERYSLWGRAATAWAAGAGVPGVLEVNAPLVEEQAEHRVLVDRAAAEDVARAALSAAAVVSCVSEPVAAWARQRAAHPARVVVVPNGVDVERVRPAAAPDGTGFTLGFVGTLKPWHGVETLVEAFARLHHDDPTYRLLLVGDGPCADDVRRRLELAGVATGATLTGAVDPDEVPALLQRMHVAAAPYPALPGFYFSPLKVYEYLAAGLPVVASDVGPLRELLGDGRLGTLVPPGDAVALADAVAALRADPSRRAAMSGAARRTAVEQHTWAGVLDRVLHLAGCTAAAR